MSSCRVWCRCLLALAFSLAEVACISGKAGTFGVISSRDPGAKFEVLSYGIEGLHCPSAFWSAGDFSTAVEVALRRVPGADVLVNAHFYTQEYGPGRLCMWAIGDAARLER